MSNSKRKIFLDNKSHEEIEDPETWAKYIYGWTDAVTAIGKCDSESLGKMMELHKIAQLVENEEISIDEANSKVNEIVRSLR